MGWKWSVATEANGVSLGWEAAGVNRHDSKLFVPTLIDVFERGHLRDIDSLHLDRGYNSTDIRQACADMGIPEVMIAPKQKPSTNESNAHFLGRRWTVERTNSWLSNFGQMRRNTDRFTKHRKAQFAFAVAMILFVKLFKHELE
jgi:transposase